MRFAQADSVVAMVVLCDIGHRPERNPRFMRIAMVGLLAVSMFKGCDLGDPKSVQPQMEQALRPYFPRVKAIAIPQRQMLVGLSCLENVGPSLIQMVPQAVAHNPAMDKLRMLRLFPGSSYRIVAVGFEQGIAWYDVDSGAMGTRPADANYAASYRKLCGIGQNASIGSANSQIQPQPKFSGRYFTPATLTAEMRSADTETTAKSYLMGAYDLTQDSGQSCAMLGTTTPQLLEKVFMDYLQTHPELTQTDRTAAGIAVEAFVEHWPCRRAGPPLGQR